MRCPQCHGPAVMVPARTDDRGYHPSHLTSTVDTDRVTQFDALVKRLVLCAQEVASDPIAATLDDLDSIAAEVKQFMETP